MGEGEPDQGDTHPTGPVVAQQRQAEPALEARTGVSGGFKRWDRVRLNPPSPSWPWIGLYLGPSSNKNAHWVLAHNGLQWRRFETYNVYGLVPDSHPARAKFESRLAAKRRKAHAVRKRV